MWKVKQIKDRRDKHRGVKSLLNIHTCLESNSTLITWYNCFLLILQFKLFIYIVIFCSLNFIHILPALLRLFQSSSFNLFAKCSSSWQSTWNPNKYLSWLPSNILRYFCLTWPTEAQGERSSLFALIVGLSTILVNSLGWYNLMYKFVI